MKKRSVIFGLLCITAALLLVAQISALDDDRERRINFGHVMVIDKIEMSPGFIAPGESGTIEVTIRNNANFELIDVRAQINLPDEIKFLNSVSKKKIGRVDSGETIEIKYDVISTPNAAEGIYNATITVDYVNHIGDERQDDDVFGILVIKSEPKIFAQIDSTEIYKGSDIGEVTITLVNNHLADLKFLTVELLESEEYKIISANKEYVGDLDSDDFESIDFRLSVNKKKGTVPLKAKLSYMDSLNKEYVEELIIPLNILSPAELGIGEGGTARVIVVVILLAVVGYYLYKRYKKKKKKEARYK